MVWHRYKLSHTSFILQIALTYITTYIANGTCKAIYVLKSSAISVCSGGQPELSYSLCTPVGAVLWWTDRQWPCEIMLQSIQVTILIHGGQRCLRIPQGLDLSPVWQLSCYRPVSITLSWFPSFPLHVYDLWFRCHAVLWHMASIGRNIQTSPRLLALNTTSCLIKKYKKKTKTLRCLVWWREVFSSMPGVQLSALWSPEICTVHLISLDGGGGHKHLHL